MKILLTNDDGFGTIGIQVLDDILSEAGHEVWVFAPEYAKSSTSHSLSFSEQKKPIEKKEHKFSFDGQPADCMMQALGKGALPVIPDLVISGINAGYNLSIDILYSGTCGAASEAALWGHKAIAISAEKPSDNCVDIYYSTARFLLRHLDEFYPILSSSIFLNINVPKASNGEDWSIGKRLTMVHRAAACPNDEGVLHNGILDLRNGVIDSDLAVCAQGLISISPIQVAPSISNKELEYLELQLKR